MRGAAMLILAPVLVRLRGFRAAERTPLDDRKR